MALSILFGMSVLASFSLDIRRLASLRSLDLSYETIPFEDLFPSNPTIDPMTNLSESCFSHNSPAWLEGPRKGNHNGSLMDVDFVRHLILDVPTILSKQGNARTLLGRVLSHESSRFLDDGEHGGDERSVRLWAVRLIYLAMHYHQHRLAIPEAETRYRYGSSCLPEMAKRNVGLFDYECPTAKFIVIRLSPYGLGSNIRVGAGTALLAGLASDRIVLFVNKSPMGSTKYLKKWALASCERGDHQCSFLPTSPCVITKADAPQAYMLSENETDKLLSIGEAPRGHESDRVWLLYPNLQQIHLNPVKLTKAVDQLRKYSVELLESVPSDDPRLPVMRRATDSIVADYKPREGYDYAAANSKVHHALYFYAMRPNQESARKIDSVLSQIISDDFNPEQALGLPIRGMSLLRICSMCLLV
jgi:hypothetical protein